MLSPSIEAFTSGNVFSASTAAFTMNGVGVSFTPWRSWKALWFSSRRRITRLMSTSKTVVTWAEVRRLMTMCSAIFLRMGLIGTTETRSPGA